MDTVCRNRGRRMNFRKDPRQDLFETSFPMMYHSPCRPMWAARARKIVAVNRKTTASGFLWVAAMAWAAVSVAGGFTLRIDGAAKSVRFPLPGNVFGLSWEHSVERTEWRETYTVGPGGSDSS